MTTEAVQLVAIEVADQVLTAVDDRAGGDLWAVPLVLYLVAAKLRAAADAGGRELTDAGHQPGRLDRVVAEQAELRDELVALSNRIESATRLRSAGGGQ